MACDKAGRGRYAPTRVVGIQDIEVINPGTAVVLKGDDTRTRATVRAVYIRITGPDEWATIYALTRETADGHGYEFERPAALVELADPPAADVADDLTATSEGGVIRWQKVGDSADWIEGVGPHASLSIWPTPSIGLPLYYASDRTRPIENVRRHSPTGTLAECKRWCEERAAELDAAPASLPMTATVAGVNGVAEVIPAADAPGF